MGREPEKRKINTSKRKQPALTQKVNALFAMRDTARGLSSGKYKERGRISGEKDEKGRDRKQKGEGGRVGRTGGWLLA